MSKASKRYNQSLGAKAYAAIAKVEGLSLSASSTKRLSQTKHLPPEQRRAEVLRAYTSSKPTRKK